MVTRTVEPCLWRPQRCPAAPAQPGGQAAANSVLRPFDAQRKDAARGVEQDGSQVAEDAARDARASGALAGEPDRVPVMVAWLLQRASLRLTCSRRTAAPPKPDPAFLSAPGEIDGRLTLAANEVKCGHGAPERILNMRVRVPQLRITKAERLGGRFRLDDDLRRSGIDLDNAGV
jgi:hypothetical protein